MALTILSRTYTDYLGRTVSFLLGNSLDPMSVVYGFEPHFGLDLSITLSVIKNTTSWTLTSGNWESYGFVVGSTVNISVTGFTGTKVISLIDGALMVVDSDCAAADGSFTAGSFYVNQAPEGIDFTFNLVPNSSGGTIGSLIDGEANRFTVDGVSAMSVAGTLSMSRIGNQSGGSAMTAILTRLADVASRRRYSITFTFKIFPWIDSSVYVSAECVSPYIRIKALPQFANPSIFIEGKNTQIANTGYVNENWNGGANNFTFQYISWKDDLTNPLTALDYTKPSNFEIRINGAFTASSKFNFKMFFPSIVDEDFKNLSTDHEKNTICAVKTTAISVATPITLTSAIHSTGAYYDITNINIVNNTTYVIITGKFIPSIIFNSLLESRDVNNRMYSIWIRCENPALDYNSSDATNVLIESNSAIKAPVPLGPWLNVRSDNFLNHNLIDYRAGSKVTNVITEDDILRRFIFRLPKFTSFKSVTGRVWAYNIVTGTRFVLDEQSVNLLAYPISTLGVIPVNFSSNRGFKLPTSSEMLNVELRRYPSIDTVTAYGLIFNFPFLERWEYWLPQDNADDDFFGSKNKNWQHFSADANWRIQSEIAIKTMDDEEYSNTILYDDRTYDDWSGVSVFTFKTIDDVVITKPLDTGLTKVKCTHTPTGMLYGAINVWGSITVEPKENAPRWLISSLNNHGSWDINPLQPLTGETKLKVTVNATNIVFECTFDASKINFNNGIKFTSRINCLPLLKQIPKNFTWKSSTGATGYLTINNSDDILTLE